MTPDNDTSEEAYAQWEISVGGSVQNPFTFKLSDFEDQMVERVYKMDCQTNPPGGAYIANVNVKGIPLSVIMDKAGVDPSANALHSIADDGWDVYPVSMEYVQQYKDDILLVTEINGEKLGMLQGRMESDQPYTIRFGISMLMRHYLDEGFKPEYPEKVAAIRSEEYYVNMTVSYTHLDVYKRQTGNRMRIREQTTAHALAMLRDCIIMSR